MEILSLEALESGYLLKRWAEMRDDNAEEKTDKYIVTVRTSNDKREKPSRVAWAVQKRGRPYTLSIN